MTDDELKPVLEKIRKIDLRPEVAAEVRFWAEAFARALEGPIDPENVMRGEDASQIVFDFRQYTDKLKRKYDGLERLYAEVTIAPDFVFVAWAGLYANGMESFGELDVLGTIEKAARKLESVLDKMYEDVWKATQP